MKDTVNRTKQQPAECEKIFINCTSSKGLISKIYNELKTLDINKPNNPIKKMDTDLNNNSQQKSLKWQRNT